MNRQLSGLVPKRPGASWRWTLPIGGLLIGGAALLVNAIYIPGAGVHEAPPPVAGVHGASHGESSTSVGTGRSSGHAPAGSHPHGATGAHCLDPSLGASPDGSCVMEIQPVMSTGAALVRIDDQRALATGDIADPMIGGSRGAARFAPQCEGTGMDGPRLRNVYAYDESLSDDSAQVSDSIRTAVEEADRVFYLSSARNQMARRLKIATEADSGGGCRVKVETLSVSHGYFTGADPLALLNALIAAGYHGDRNTQGTLTTVFLDDRAKPMPWCGWASMTVDDRVDGWNSQITQRLAALSARCWTAGVYMHEVAHMMGAVNKSAPNTTGWGHCTDGADILCYYDGGPTAAQRIVCPPTRYRPMGMLDCNHDDYLDVDPEPGSYLATHFNIAASPFARPVGAPQSAPPSAWVTGGQTGGLVDAGVAFSATIDVPAGVAFVGRVDAWDSCPVILHAPIEQGATYVTVSGVATCSVEGVDAGRTSAALSIVDSLGRDIEASIPVGAVIPSSALATRWDARLRERDGEFWLEGTLLGASGPGAAIDQRLAGVRWALYDMTAREYLSAANATTSADGSVSVEVGSDRLGHELDLRAFTNTRAWQQPSVWLTVGGRAQWLSVTKPNEGLVGTSAAISASAASGGVVALESLSPLVCTLDGSTLSFGREGMCTVSARQAGHDVWQPVETTVEIPVSRRPQGITVDLGVSYLVNDIVALMATSTSGGVVSVVSQTPRVCQIEGSNAIAVASGVCQLVFSQAGDETYQAAALAQTFTVRRRAQTVTTSSIKAGRVGQTRTFTATASSGLWVSVTVRTPDVCTLKGTRTLVLRRAGTCMVVYTQSGNVAWAPARSVTRMLTVRR